jgi:hypothetical protein
MSVFRLVRSLHTAVIRSAALLVPAQERREWLDEWTSELWYVRQRGDPEATRFCMGAFQDAFWLRRNNPEVWRPLRFESPAWCVLFLAGLAAVSVFFALRLPGPRDVLLPSPYPHARNLTMIAADGRFASQVPTVPFADYQSLANRAQHLFTSIAFYQPVRARLRIEERETGELSVALASGNLFELLDLPFSGLGAGEPAAMLVLSDATWRQSFHGDPDVVGRVVEVGERKAVVGGVIQAASWRLPGEVDAWLLENPKRFAELPRAKGFVLAHLGTSSRERHLHWQMSLPNEQGGYDRFECASVDRRQNLFAHLLMLFTALLILLVTTSLTLGEYPANRHSPPLRTRLRRWVFLAVKVALLIVIVFCGVLDLASLTWTPIQPHGLLVGYVLVFRWALKDQRERCPVCLRLLTNPTPIGWSSQTFLEWYGTELMCVRGHGLLHVTEIPSSSYGAQRWLYLDRSWGSLFSTPCVRLSGGDGRSGDLVH